MHQRAEWGVAAHWAYKDGSPSADIDWLNRIIDWQAEVSDPAQFMQSLKTDLEQDEVFVFTPKGRVVTLPLGSTTVDFAYAVHTEVGHACIGAKVNGRLVSLDHQLASGDTCEIFTSKVETAGPSQDWLGFVESPRARNKIRQWFSRERRVDMIEARAATSSPRSCAGRACRCSGCGQLGAAQGGDRRPQLRRPRRPAGGDRRAPRLGAVDRPARRPRLPGRRRRGAAAGHSCCGRARQPHRRRTRSASTSRASTTCSCAWRSAARRCPATRSSASSPVAAG